MVYEASDPIKYQALLEAYLMSVRGIDMPDEVRASLKTAHEIFNLSSEIFVTHKLMDADIVVYLIADDVIWFHHVKGNASMLDVVVLVNLTVALAGKKETNDNDHG